MSQLTNKIRHGDFQGASKSIAGGAALDKKDKNGNTPLHIAVQVDNEDITCLLLQYGASPDIKNAKRKKPADLETNAAKHILNHSLNNNLPIKNKVCKKAKI